MEVGSAGGGVLETEIKLRIEETERMRRRLEELGFNEKTGRTFEDNWMFDFPEQTLRQARSLLRLRRYGDRFMITFKGPSDDRARHKVREEVETSVENGDAMREILERLGLRESFRYQKWRTEFSSPSEPVGHVLLDETPIGVFVELEGEAGWIDRTAQDLGFSSRDYILKSYSVLFADHCSTRGIQSQEMIFESRAACSEEQAGS